MEAHLEHEDYNFMAAYYHILADALTSVLAIFALLIGKFLHISCLDPIVGILGGILILRWAVSLIKDTVKILVDRKD
jgi:Co/Zn/Cd efflux system component